MARYDKQWREKVKIKTKEYFKNLPEEHRKILQENGRKSVKIMHSKRKQKPFEELKAWTAIRKRIFEERGRICEKCGLKDGTENYQNMLAEMLALYYKCHNNSSLQNSY